MKIEKTRDKVTLVSAEVLSLLKQQIEKLTDRKVDGEVILHWDGSRGGLTGAFAHLKPEDETGEIA